MVCFALNIFSGELQYSFMAFHQWLYAHLQSQILVLLHDVKFYFVLSAISVIVSILLLEVMHSNLCIKLLSETHV